MRCLSLLICLWVASAGAADRKLTVAIAQEPPFAMKTADGSWTGVSVDLWREVARDLKWDFEFREVAWEELLAGVANGRYDAGVSSISITPERERTMDFTHPYFVSGLGVATMSGRTQHYWWLVLRDALSHGLLTLVLWIAVWLLVTGSLMWLCEHRRNDTQFGNLWWHGLGAGLWWSATTMTTVGYGDKVPRTFWGRFVAVLWMFGGVALVAAFTALITSSLAVSRFSTLIHNVSDLTRLRVATVANTTAVDYLREHGVHHLRSCPDVANALNKLTRGEVDAVVFDAPLLRYTIQQTPNSAVQVLGQPLNREYYGFAFRNNSPLREPLNLALLRKLSEPVWQQIQLRYLGH
jgi:ABC-type amino acid transport substrate-binding protein